MVAAAPAAPAAVAAPAIRRPRAAERESCVGWVETVPAP